MARATPAEQRLLAGLVSGELRQGALDGVLTEAVATAAEVPAAEVRRAVTVAGICGRWPNRCSCGEAPGLVGFRLVVGAPVRPMLAQSAPTLTDAFERTGPAAIEWKLDGIRVQAHRDGSAVSIFTRTLDDVTERVPELVEVVSALPVRSAVLDGETIALDRRRPSPALPADSSPRSANGSTSSAPGRGYRCRHSCSTASISTAKISSALPVSAPVGSADRESCPPDQRVPRLVTDDVEAAQAFFDTALDRGHEGVVVKSLSAPYEAGRRGAGWVKVKPRHTLDLVVLAVEWGHGRRQGSLSNLHLGARDPAGRVRPAGRLCHARQDLQRADRRHAGVADHHAARASPRAQPTSWVVTVRPELVVEVAFDGVQQSPRYPAGMALRFARVLRHRPDKSAAEADTIDSVRAIHDRQVG